MARRFQEEGFLLPLNHRVAYSRRAVLAECFSELSFGRRRSEDEGRQNLLATRVFAGRLRQSDERVETAAQRRGDTCAERELLAVAQRVVATVTHGAIVSSVRSHIYCGIDMEHPEGFEDLEGLVGITDVAALLGVPSSWIYERTATGAIPHYRVGRYVRFRISEIDQWLAQHSVGPKQGTKRDGTPWERPAGSERHHQARKTRDG